MESLIADFCQFPTPLSNFSLRKENFALGYVCSQCQDFLKALLFFDFLNFKKSGNSSDNGYKRFYADNNLVVQFHLQFKKITLTG